MPIQLWFIQRVQGLHWCCLSRTVLWRLTFTPLQNSAPKWPLKKWAVFTSWWINLLFNSVYPVADQNIKRHEQRDACWYCKNAHIRTYRLKFGIWIPIRTFSAWQSKIDFYTKNSPQFWWSSSGFSCVRTSDKKLIVYVLSLIYVCLDFHYWNIFSITIMLAVQYLC